MREKQLNFSYSKLLDPVKATAIIEGYNAIGTGKNHFFIVIFSWKGYGAEDNFGASLADEPGDAENRDFEKSKR